MTWSPFLSVVTPAPTSTTTPAPSCPRIAGKSPSGSAPERVNSSVWQIPVALISTSTSPALGPSSRTVSTTSGSPALCATAARMSMRLSSQRSSMKCVGNPFLQILFEPRCIVELGCGIGSAEIENLQLGLGRRRAGHGGVEAQLGPRKIAEARAWNAYIHRARGRRRRQPHVFGLREGVPAGHPERAEDRRISGDADDQESRGLGRTARYRPRERNAGRGEDIGLAMLLGGPGARREGEACDGREPANAHADPFGSSEAAPAMTRRRTTAPSSMRSRGPAL